ncbi:MAG: non-hydrolyzing UDP-N-acetylglucosamine 2-epimerase [Mycoplasma sp.]
MKLKVMTIVGTRPEIIRLSVVMKKMDLFFDHIIINTMQNFDKNLNDIFFKDLNVRCPDYTLEVKDKNAGHVIGNIISQTYDLMIKEKPDCILILGDTNSALSAISAKRLKIPIFHMEAGNRSYDLNLPEEINRTIVDSISDINLPYTERARSNLLEEGHLNREVFKTGSPLFEVLDFYSDKIKQSKIINNLKLKKDDFFLVSIHRDENTSDINKLIKLLNNIVCASKTFNKKIVISLHPKTKNILEENSYKISKDFIISEPLGFFDYINLQKNSFCVISDSGSLAEESFILNFNAVSLRNSTERQESFESAAMSLGNIEKDTLINSINFSISKKQNNIKYHDYLIPNVSDIIINLIQSFSKIIKDKYN